MVVSPVERAFNTLRSEVMEQSPAFFVTLEEMTFVQYECAWDEEEDTRRMITLARRIAPYPPNGYISSLEAAVAEAKLQRHEMMDQLYSERDAREKR